MNITVATDNDKMIQLSNISSDGLSYRCIGNEGSFNGIKDIEGATLFDCTQTDIDKIFTDISLNAIGGEISFHAAQDSIHISNEYMLSTQEEK